MRIVNGPVPPARSTSSPLPLTSSSEEEDEALLWRLARLVVARRLTTPVILLLESLKPMNFVGAQLLVFLDPLVRIFLTVPDYTRIIRMLENRATIERLILCVEEVQDEIDTRRSPER